MCLGQYQPLCLLYYDVLYGNAALSECSFVVSRGRALVLTLAHALCMNTSDIRGGSEQAL